MQIQNRFPASIPDHRGSGMANEKMVPEEQNFVPEPLRNQTTKEFACRDSRNQSITEIKNNQLSDPVAVFYLKTRIAPGT